MSHLHTMTVESSDIVEGLKMEVEYGYTKGEQAQTQGPVEMCHPGSADEVELDTVMVPVPDGFDPIDILEALNERAIDDITQFISEHHDNSDPRY